MGTSAKKKPKKLGAEVTKTTQQGLKHFAVKKSPAPLTDSNSNGAERRDGQQQQPAPVSVAAGAGAAAVEKGRFVAIAASDLDEIRWGQWRARVGEESEDGVVHHTSGEVVLLDGPI